MGCADLGPSVRGPAEGIPPGHEQDGFEIRALKLMDVAEMLPHPLELHGAVAPGTCRT
jgi:hypothetical protein